MKRLRVAALLLFVVLLAAGAVFLRGALQVALAYSAKQMCSGVFVAGLPPDFVREKDIDPSLALLGPLRGALEVLPRRDSGDAVATLLGARAHAVHDAQRGCMLHGDGPGAPPRSPGDAPVPADTEPGIDRLLDAAFAEPGGGVRNTLAVLVALDGELIAERYAAPVSAATRLQGWSMNKSLMATWIALQAQRGALDPSRPVVELIGDPQYAASIVPRMTLFHLLQMESGLDFLELYGPGSDVTRMLYRSHAMWQLPASQSQAHPPGSHFSYSSGDTVLASRLWQQSLEQPYPQWIETHFARPLGIHSLVAEADASGTQVGSSFVYMTARDWMRVGQLWLDAWHGRSTLLPQAWMRESLRARDSDPRGRYGRGFWLNTAGVSFEGLPDSLFFASGHNGQYLVVIPEWELVLLRLGLTQGASSGTGDLLRGLAAQRNLAP